MSFSDFLVFVSHFGKKHPARTFNIEAVIDDAFSQEEKAIIRRAIARWEEIVVGDLPDTDYSVAPFSEHIDWLGMTVRESGVVDDLKIYFGRIYTVENSDVSRLAGLGSRCSGYDFELAEYQIGCVGLDVTGIREGEYPEFYRKLFYRVACHEIGHALGIGTVFRWFELLDGRMFTGQNAVRAFKEAGGQENVSVAEDLAHWDGDVLKLELMSSWPDSTTVISAITVQALLDLGLGYVVDVEKADAYKVP